MGSIVDGEEVGRDEGVLISTRWVGGDEEGVLSAG